MVEENVGHNGGGPEVERPELEQTARDQDLPGSQVAAKSPENTENEDFKKRYYYLAAEMENTKKRFDREKANLLKYGTDKVLSALVEVVDNLERCIETMNGDQDEKVVKIATGIKMVREQFLGVLSDNGLKKVNALGEIFDPNFHEALSQQEVAGKKDMEIIQVFLPGYLLQDRLLRPAKVVVAKSMAVDQ